MGKMRIKIEKKDQDRLTINSLYAKVLDSCGISTAEDLWTIKGEPVKRALKERTTEKVFLGNIECYIKRHTRAPFKQALKSAMSLKFKKYDSLNEWNAILKFHENDLPTMKPVAVAFSENGNCILTEGIKNYTRASELLPELLKNSNPGAKKELIRKVALFAGRMHALNMAHQDFYLVHVFVDNHSGNIYLIDLQRVIFQQNLKCRWKIKDLAQLLFSSHDFVTRRDILTFWKIYNSCCSYKYYKNMNFIKKIFKKAKKIKKHTEKIYAR
jgi:tRNA A-37 threonylcarbamoyl transferase component Bud32